MRNLIVVLLAAAVFLPLSVSADSYDGPYCFEDPIDPFIAENYKDGNTSIRGTCREIEFSSIISLDSELQNSYLIARHERMGVGLEREGFSDYAQYSELMTPEKDGVVILSNDEFIYDYYNQGKYHLDEIALLDKDFTLDFITTAYTDAGLAVPETLPRLGIMNRSEMKTLLAPTYSEYSYEELLALSKPGKSTVIVSEFLPAYNTSPTIYTFESEAFSQHISSLKAISGVDVPAVIESSYHTVDTSVLPPDMANAGVTKTNVKTHTIYHVSITNPIISAENHWNFKKQGKEIVLSWDRTVYRLDDGSTRTITRTEKDKDLAVLEGEISEDSAAPQEEADHFSTTPEKGQGLFEGIWNWIVSLFR